MKIEAFTKPIITYFVTVDGIEFELSHLIRCLYDICDTGVDDKSGDYSLRAYELTYKDDMDKLVKMGLVKNYIGPRQANLYCRLDAKGLEELEDLLYDIVYDEEDEIEYNNN